MSDLPATVDILEEGPREGFQIEPDPSPPPTRSRWSTPFRPPG
ncbi:hypothetical protein ACFQU7_14040 [Pseudoroseomonas wenyumeiae]